MAINPAKAPAAEEEEDEDVDLFGSDDEEEDAEAERLKAERVAAYNAKKAAKPKTIAKVRTVYYVYTASTDMYHPPACTYLMVEYDVDYLHVVFGHPRCQALG